MAKTKQDSGGTVKHLIPTSIETLKGSNNSWPEELKLIANTLVDLAVRNFSSSGTKLILNEILTVDELATRFKVPSSTIEELARKGKLPGAFRVGKHWRFDLDLLRSSLISNETVDV